MHEGSYAEKTVRILNEIRRRKPVIHHITNMVVMNSTANVTLATGASPIMAHAREEMEAVVSFADALNLNIGTLTTYWIDSMIAAGKAAGTRGIPIVLDPVGSGATPMRTEAVKHILGEVPVTVIRGNASEMRSMCASDEKIKIKGVDSLESVEAVRDGACKLARDLKKVIAVTGAVDFITDGTTNVEVRNGHPLFERITGAGCGVTAVVSCFCAVEHDPLIAASCALGYYGLAGEEAARISKGPGTFQVALYDALYNISEETMLKKLKIMPVK